MTTGEAYEHFEENESRTGRDDFNRKPIAEKLIQLLDSGSDISPLVIDGGWGTGKTEFCKKTINLIKEQSGNELLPIYIDAFQADHMDEPLLTLLAAIIAEIPEDERHKARLLEKAKGALRFTLKTAFKSTVAWTLRVNAEDMVEEFNNALRDAGSYVVDQLLQDQIEAEQKIQALQEVLSEIAQEKKIILFVDELDRCRPDYAVNMLETIKHVFDIENVKFALITNTQQLRASINHCYGPLIDAQKYLDKFLKFSLRLPEHIVGTNHRAAESHFIKLVSESRVLNSEGFAGPSPEIACYLIQHNNLSLRETETFFRHLEIYQTLSSGKLSISCRPGLQILRTFGVFIICIKPEIIESIKRRNTDAEIITSLLVNHEWETSATAPYLDEDIKIIAEILARESTINNISPELIENTRNQQGSRKKKLFGSFPINRLENKFTIIEEVIDTLSFAKE